MNISSPSHGLFFQDALRKYRMSFGRFQGAVRTGVFVRLTVRKKRQLLQRILRYENQLRHAGISLMASIALMLPLQTLQAQPVPKGDAFRVGTTTGFSQGYPVIGADNDGDFVVSWQSYGQDGQYWGIYAQRYDSSGTALGNEFRVNTYTAGSQQSPSIGTDGSGFVIAWQSFPQESFSMNIYAQRYDSLGVPKGAEFRVNAFTTGSHKNPAVSMDDQGYFCIVWEDSQMDGDGYGIFGRRFSKNGVPMDTEMQINPVSEGHQNNPVVAGGFYPVFAWENSDMISSPSDIRLKYSWFPQSTQPNTYTSGNQRDPAIVFNPYFHAAVVVVWESEGQDGDGTGIYGRRYTSNFSSTPEFAINTYTTGNQRNPALAITDQGLLIVVWESWDQDGDGRGIFGQRYLVDGTPDGSEFQINTYTTGHQSNPSVAIDVDGDFVVTWEGEGADGSGIYARRYAAPCYDAVAWYLDQDQDGFGVHESFPYISCVPLAGRVSNDADCDDGVAAIHPASAELCNGIDDNCDGRIDDSVVDCPVPVALSETTVTNSSAVLDWNPVSCARSYKVKLVRLSDDLTINLKSNTDSIVVSGLTASAEYKWRVRTKCRKLFFSAFSPWQYFTTGGLALEAVPQYLVPPVVSPQDISDITVFPNPAQALVRVTASDKMLRKIVVTDMVGNVILEISDINTGEAEIDTSRLPSGSYTLNISWEGGSCSKPLVLIK